MNRGALSLVLAVGILEAISAQEPRPGGNADAPLTLLAVQGTVHVLGGAGGNITVQVGDDGVLLVDSGAAASSGQVLEQIQRVSRRPIRGIINTAADPDHIGGNAALAKGGSPLFAAGGGGAPPPIRSAQIFAHENVLLRLSAPTGALPQVPFSQWPTDTFTSDLKTLYLNGEPIELIHQPKAHSDGDVMVFFRGSDVISAGDVFLTDGYPTIGVRGGSLRGTLDALNRIIRITVPAFNQQGGTRVIPGHGRMSNEADVVEYRDMLTIIRDRVYAMVGKGMTADQVRAARPTRDYDGIYGASAGPWTTAQFVDALYAELQRSGIDTR